MNIFWSKFSCFLVKRITPPGVYVTRWVHKIMNFKWHALTPGGLCDSLSSEFFHKGVSFSWFLSEMHQPRGSMWRATLEIFMIFKWNASTPGVYATRYAHEIHDFFYKEVIFFRWFCLSDFFYREFHVFLSKIHQPRGSMWRVMLEIFMIFFKKKWIFLSEFLFWVSLIFFDRNFHVFLSKTHQPRGGLCDALSAWNSRIFYKEVIFFEWFFFEWNFLSEIFWVIFFEWNFHVF